jgi:hypothetical protein
LASFVRNEDFFKSPLLSRKRKKDFKPLRIDWSCPGEQWRADKRKYRKTAWGDT